VARNNRAALIRRTADDTLRESRANGPPVPIEAIVASQGLGIDRIADPRLLGEFDRDRWTIGLGADLFDEVPHNRHRRRLTLAHELGHCLLEHGEAPCWNLPALGEAGSLTDLNDSPDYEFEAYAFARELLVPRHWFKGDWETAQDVMRWSMTYAVSREVIFIVLEERRLLMQRKPPQHGRR